MEISLIRVRPLIIIILPDRSKTKEAAVLQLRALIQNRSIKNVKIAYGNGANCGLHRIIEAESARIDGALSSTSGLI
jgi:hypothetical protein